MKTFTRILAFLMIMAPFSSFGQQAVNNLDFESWGTSLLGGPAPSGFPVTYEGSENTTDPYSGSSALKVTSAYESTFIGDTVGICYNQGEGYTMRPDSVSGYIRYNVASGDTASIIFQLTTYDPGQDSTHVVGTAFALYPNATMTSNPVSNWTQVGIPFVYDTTATPDSISVFFNSESGYILGIGGQRSGNVLEADSFELHFDTASSILSQKPTEEAGMDVYPNPSNGRFQVDLKNVWNGTVEVRDIKGRVIRQKAMTNDSRVEMNMESAEKGVYFVRLRNEEGKTVSVEKIVLTR
ncbi:MAG: T9SS type A sorting domain-containing protein [Flavobacteriales bacterium]